MDVGSAVCLLFARLRNRTKMELGTHFRNVAP